MKYIITERQLGLINEDLTRMSGNYRATPLDDFFMSISSLGVKKKDFTKAFFNFFNKIGFKINHISPTQVLMYWQDLENDRSEIFDNRNFYKKDIVSGFAYHIAKNYIGLKESAKGELEYIRVGKDSRSYYFFDPAFKIFVGGILINKDDEIKGNSYEVKTSGVDRELIGGRYGLKMYMTVISDVDYLSSDSILFSGSYRMWSKSLPKYVNVWIEKSNEDNPWEFIKITGEERRLPKGVEKFVASRYHKEVRRK